MNTVPAQLVAQARIDSPLGPLLAAATAKGLAGLWFEGQKDHPGTLEAPKDPAQRWLRQAAEELALYWRGSLRRPFRVTLDLRGSDFQRAVWRALLEIEPGRTSTYGEIARRAGRPLAARAAGMAIGRNPVSVIVPCHRVIGADGSLTGYAGGLTRKQALLRLEGALA